MVPLDFREPRRGREGRTLSREAMSSLSDIEVELRFESARCKGVSVLVGCAMDGTGASGLVETLEMVIEGLLDDIAMEVVYCKALVHTMESKRDASKVNGRSTLVI